MRILHFIPSIDSATGGPVEGLRQHCNIYRISGVEVEVASLDAPEFVAAYDFPAKTIGLGPGWGKYRYSPRAVPWLKANLDRFDVLIVHGIWNYTVVAAHRALAGTDVPWAIFIHGMLDPYFKQRYRLKHLKKLAYWKLLLSKALHDATAVLFTCEEERIRARESFRQYSVHESVVPYGTFGPNCDTAVASEAFLAQWPELRGKRLALTLGRIHPKKATDLLIQSFAATLGKDEQWHLVIAGPDQIGWKKELEAQAERLGIAHRITWTGILADSLKWGAFSAAELFVLPSHQENFGIVVAEALACGLPVVISDKVNIWREVAKYNTGFINADTAEGTEASLRCWAALTDEERLALRLRATECFHAEFDFNQAARVVLKNIESLAHSTPRYQHKASAAQLDVKQNTVAS